MPCYRPLKGYRAAERDPKTGNRRVVFNKSDAATDQPVEVPCGQCVGCRLERSRQWAVRCVHEAQMHEENAFITLTYNNEHLPKNLSLDKRHWQLFVKKLRKYHAGKIKYFHCGEYGEQRHRPHYHACLFGVDFPDKVLWKKKDDVSLYVSQKLQDIWGKGFCTVGDVTFESAAYTARYIMKKVTGEKAAEHYGERIPEYTTMSRGIGKSWLEKFHADVYPHDYVVINGAKMRPPRFYDKILSDNDPVAFRKVRGDRVKRAKEVAEDNTQRRQRVKEKVRVARANLLIRNVE